MSKYLADVLAALLVAAALLRLGLRARSRRRAGRGPAESQPGGGAAGGQIAGVLPRLFGDAGLVAQREVRERLRGRAFRGGTLFLLVAVSAAIVIPAEVKAHKHTHAAHSAAGHGATLSNIGLIMVFLMLSQYNSWTLIGVLEEKSSRIAEVLLAVLRPAQLLAGKVLGIGLVAFAQAALVAGTAEALSKAVGRNLLHGTSPLVLAASLAWLVLGYACYSWAYAAAGAMTERRDQAQSLLLPLALPMLFGFTLAQTALVSGHASTLVEVLAYLPPTAPFAMPVLVGIGAVSWWEFAASALISVLFTVLVARLAIGVYSRAILRTGRRVRLREVLRTT